MPLKTELTKSFASRFAKASVVTLAMLVVMGGAQAQQNRNSPVTTGALATHGAALDIARTGDTRPRSAGSNSVPSEAMRPNARSIRPKPRRSS